MDTQMKKVEKQEKWFVVGIETYAKVPAENAKEALSKVVDALNLDLDLHPETGVYFRQYDGDVEELTTGETWSAAQLMCDEDDEEDERN